MSAASKLSNPNIRVVVVATDPGVAESVRNVNANDGGSGYPVHLVSTMREAREWIAAQPRLHGFRIPRF